MSVLQGTLITASIFRRVQLDDDDQGGAQHQKQRVLSNVPTTITQMPTPNILKAQGIENVDNFDCVMQPSDYTPLDIQMDDILVPDSGQYRGLEFVITNVFDNVLADNPIDYRFIHKRLSLRRVTPARSIQ